MKLTKWRAVAIGAGVALCSFAAQPANAAGPDESAVADDGVDFDAACIANNPTVLVPPGTPDAPNSVESPGGAGTGCTASLYDGNTQATDIAKVDLSSYVAGGEVWLKAEVVVDGAIPAAGTVPFTQPNLQTPHDIFRGIGLKVLYQNRDKQHNADNPLPAGCTTIDSRKQRDQSGHWRDGWHYFIGFDVTHDGEHYVHTVSSGVYDPTPDGAFFFDEFGVNNGSTAFDFDQRGASADDVFHRPVGAAATPAGTGRWEYTVDTSVPGQTTVTVETTGLVRNADDLCALGYHTTDYGSENAGVYSLPGYTGDRLFDIKGLSTANQVVLLPVTVPLSATCTATMGLICESDLTSIGGFVFFSDTTQGGSTPGNFNFTTGPAVNISGIAYSGGLLGLSDTLGETHTCPTPTFGGLLPDNPFWLASPNVSCEIDDNGFNRGSLLSEWWDTASDYTIP